MPIRLLRIGAGVLIALALYALLGFWVAPVVALRITNDKLAELAAVPARLEQIRFNPFTLQLELYGLRFGEAGAEQVGFQRLAANLQVDSLWRRQVHLASVELTQPKVQVLIAADGTLNLAQLFKPSNAPEQPATTENDSPFPVTIDTLALSQGYVHFRDARSKAPVEFTYDAMDFQLRHLTTLPKGDAEMELTARGAGGWAAGAGGFGALNNRCQSSWPSASRAAQVSSCWAAMLGSVTCRCARSKEAPVTSKAFSRTRGLPSGLAMAKGARLNRALLTTTWACWVRSRV